MSQRLGTHVPAVRAEAEKILGITQRSAPLNFSWTGDIRKRYTDFLVNEIGRDGVVLHLRDYEEDKSDPASKPDPNDRKPPFAKKLDNKPKVDQISEDDRKIVEALIGESVAEKLIRLDENIQTKKFLAASERSVSFEPITDRAKRATVHQEIRRIFRSRLDTTADQSGVITATPTKWNSRARRDNNRSRDLAREFAALGGDYLHFTLYKENKDTMDAINTIARLLKIKASNFGFAGTKDRRASTVQRISVLRQKAANLVWLNSRIPNVKVAQFAYSETPLQLGDHGGNEFVITLKNCEPLGGNNCSLAQRMKMIQQAVECGLAYLKHRGYINYYGLQRFGTYAIGTHLLGMKILQSDFEGFIDDVLHVDGDLMHEVFSSGAMAHGAGKDAQNTRDELNRARAITTWKATKDAEKALEFLPKRYSSETAIIRHLGKDPRDFNGAVLSITRGMRMMYTHAYQSYVWNFIATLRWSKYGTKVIEGDLILTNRRRASSEDYNPYDDADDDITRSEAHVVTADEVASGKYTIFDIVLPTPGWDVIYPQNDIGDYYVEFMGRPENGCLDPHNMRRKHREFSLSGNYRPILGRFIGEPQYAIRAYCDDTEQMYPTDLDYALHKKAADRRAKAAKAAQAQPALDRWAHFARNATTYDDALAAERRRKAEQEPSSDSVVTTRETWVQTGVEAGFEGSVKRVKLARHHQQMDVRATTPTRPTGESALLGDDDDNNPTYPVGRGAPLTSPVEDDSPRVITDGPIPMITIPKGAIPTSGIRGVSDAYYAETGKMPYYGMIPPSADAGPGAQPQLLGALYPVSKPPSNASGGAASQGQQHPLTLLDPEVKPDSSGLTETKEPAAASGSDFFDWYGANMPKLPSVPAHNTAGQGSGAIKDTTKGKEPANASCEAEVINKVAVPKFRTVSANPLSSMGEAIDEANINPKARKIAVTLKFQLKISNYATIVLRELMGTTAEERAPH